MDKHKMDPADFTVETFETNPEAFTTSERIMDCTGCISGCGIFPDPA